MFVCLSSQQNNQLRIFSNFDYVISSICNCQNLRLYLSSTIKSRLLSTFVCWHFSFTFTFDYFHYFFDFFVIVHFFQLWLISVVIVFRDKLILFEITVILIFQFNDYNQVQQNFHFDEFNNDVRQFLQQIIFDKFHSSAVKSVIRNIRFIFWSLSSYSVDWLLIKTFLRRVIERFIRKIVVFRAAFFFSFKFRQQNSNNSFSIESFVLKSQRFRFQSFISNLREFIFSSIISVFDNSIFQRSSFSSSAAFDFFVSRVSSVSIFNIESADHDQRQFIQSSINQNNIRQFINHFTNSTFFNTDMIDNNNQNVDFIQTQMNMLKIMINRTIRNAQSTFEFSEFFESSKSQNTSTSSDDNETENNNRWNFDEIDFFDSMYDEKSIVID